jgi:hypothetical protein
MAAPQPGMEGKLEASEGHIKAFPIKWLISFAGLAKREEMLLAASGNPALIAAFYQSRQVYLLIMRGGLERPMLI